MKLGRLNVGSDHLSYIDIGEEPANLEEGLPDVQFFMVGVVDNHFVEINHFLTTGTAPKVYTSQ